MPHHQAFVDYFVHEFMEELWYLQKVVRGDIPTRQEADPWGKFFNVTQGLLSLAPIPGLPLGFLLSKELIKKCMDYGEKALKLAREVNKEAKAGYEKSQEFLAKVDQLQEGYESLVGKPESKGMLQQEGPLDLTAIRVLVEWVGRGLAERYEHVLSEYLDTRNPEKSYIPLARVMAKRLFEYLQSQPFLARGLSGDWVAQCTRLLHGVVLAKVDKSWREQITGKASSFMPKIVQNMHKATLPLQDAPKKRLGKLEKFTAEGVIVESAWYDAKQSYAHKSTAWQTPKNQPKLPKYGYVYLGDAKQLPLEMKAVLSASQPPYDRRYYRSIGVMEIQSYLSSLQVQAARKAKKTCDYSFHDFLRDQGHPKDLQAVCHEDLTTIQDWSFANLRGVDFSGACLTGNISGTHFGGAYLVGAVAKDIVCDKNYPANFSKAQLDFGDWRRAKLPKADFTQADLSLVNLSGADLTAIHTEGTVWYKADLTDVARRDLLAEQAKQVEKAQQKLRASFHQMEKQLHALEQRLEPELIKLHALEEQSEQTAATTQKLEEKIGQLQTAITEKTAPLQQQIAMLQQQMAQRGENNVPASAQIQQLQQQIDALSVPLQQQVAILETQAKNAAARMKMISAEIANLQTALYEEVNKAFKNQCDRVLQRLDERMDGLNENIAHVQQQQGQVLDFQQQLLAAIQAQPDLLRGILGPELASMKRLLIQLKPSAPIEQKSAPKQPVLIEQSNSVGVVQVPAVTPKPAAVVDEVKEVKAPPPTLSFFQQNQQKTLQDDPVAMFNLAEAYYHGDGVAQDHKIALQWYQKAAAKGHVAAQCEWGIMLFKGKGGPQNVDRAFELFQAVAPIHGKATFMLGYCHERGRGAPQDFKKALSYYQTAVDQGHTEAQKRYQAVAQHLGLPGESSASRSHGADAYATPKQNVPSAGPSS